MKLSNGTMIDFFILCLGKIMILAQCPHCHVRHVSSTNVFEQRLKQTDASTTWFIQRCLNQKCQSLILVERADKGLTNRIFPFSAYALDANSAIPAAILEDFGEAGLCLGAGCFKASLVMSRRVLQRCLKDQGCTQYKLVDAIKYAVENAILRKAFHPLAEEIRQYGNLGAHPDDDQLENANRGSAHQVLEFARLLIHEFYEIPASADLLKQSRKN